MRRALATLAGRLLRAFDGVAGTRLRDALRAGLRVAGAIGPDLRGRMRILGAAILLATTRRPQRIRLRGGRLFTVPDVAGLRVLEEVFCDGEYAEPLPVEPRHILDLGSNIGASVLYFAWRYPGARITGVEASPALFRLLEANVGDLPNVTLRHVAVGATAEPTTFYEGVSSWAGATQVTEWVRPDRAMQVPGAALDDLLDGVDMVKMDVEGAEFDILPRSGRLGEVRAILGEIHAPPRTPETERMLALLDGFHVQSTEPDPSTPQHSTVFSAVRF